MKKLCPTFTESSGYFGLARNMRRMGGSEAAALRKTVLKRDRHRCVYCDFDGERWQNISYLDGDSSNNELSNLATVCPMCYLIVNARLGCQIEGIVELYRKADYDQNRIVQMSRKMRCEGKDDSSIIRILGLKEKVPFKMDKKYLSVLYAFVTSWKGSRGEMEEALSYVYEEAGSTTS